MIVKLRDREASFPDLTPDQPYVVLGIEAEDLRILNDQGRPYLYPADLFHWVDAREPADWVSALGEDTERYAYPPPWNALGFFEDYFDGVPEAVATFWRVMNQRLSAAAAVGAGIEGRLARSLERLRSYSPADLDRDILDFARSEVEVEDPFQARRLESPDVHGIGALFGDPVE